MICFLLYLIDNESDFSGLQRINPTKENLSLYIDTTGMTEDEISIKKIEFERETKEVKVEFSRLLHRLQKSLEKSCRVDDVVNLLINLDDEDMFKRCKLIADVFKKANKFCSFFETKVVKLLVEELGTDHDRDNYENYKRKFQSFCLKRVFLFPDGKSSQEIGNKLAMETDKHIEGLPEEQKKQLQYEISRVFKGKRPVKLFSNEQLKPTQAICSSDTSQAFSVAHNTIKVTNSKATTVATLNETSSFITSSKAASITGPSEASTPIKVTSSITAPSEGSTPSKAASTTTSSEASSFTTPSKAASTTAPSEASSFTTPSKATSTHETSLQRISFKRRNVTMLSSKSSYTEVSKKLSNS